MELLLILPLIIGWGLYELFSTDSSDNTAEPNPDPDNGNNEPTPQIFSSGDNAEEMKGGNDDDVMAGGGGKDTVLGGNADDLMLGEGGDDSMRGTQGYDTMLGGAGDDTIAGGRGQDWLIGGAGEDFMNGGEGDDTMSGSSGADTLDGYKGDDVISGFDVRNDASALAVNLQTSIALAAKQAATLEDYVTDKFDVTSSPDVVERLNDGLSSANTADKADDVLFGGRGNDTLTGDFSDTMTGGNGADRFDIISDGANQAVTVTDLNTSLDSLNVYVPAGTKANVTLVDGATPADGVSVVIAGDTVAVLKGLTSAQLPAAFVNVKFL